jgi:transcriptional regulator with XRE-family HTH domain
MQFITKVSPGKGICRLSCLVRADTEAELAALAEIEGNGPAQPQRDMEISKRNKELLALRTLPRYDRARLQYRRYMDMAFSDNLQFLRTKAGMTQEQLAEELEVSRQSVSKWEGGQSFPEMETLLRLCDRYDVDLDTLLRGSVEKSREGDTAQYDRFMDVFSWRIALSVGAILLGVALQGFLDAYGVSEAVSCALFLLVVTVSVVVMVASGIQYSAFCKEHPTIVDFYTPKQRSAFQRKFVWLISGGVGAILFGVVLLTLGEQFLEEEFYGDQMAAVFLAIVAGAVTTFVYGGLQSEKYNVEKYNRENNPTPEVKARKGLISMICGGLMVTVTAVYVGLGLALHLWGTTWWVFAVGGILCGVVNITLNPYRGMD